MTQRGFTLIEVAVVTGVSLGVLGALMMILLVGRSSYYSAEASVQAQQEARRAFDAITKELREAGQVNNNVSIPAPGVQRLDFQVARSYDATLCGGICWGTDDAGWPTGWVHYALETTAAQNTRLLRCVTANRLDPMPAGFAGCRVLANAMDPDVADTAFTYDQAARTVTVKLRTAVVSSKIPGGGVASSSGSLTTQVKLRN